MCKTKAENESVLANEQSSGGTRVPIMDHPDDSPLAVKLVEGADSGEPCPGCGSKKTSLSSRWQKSWGGAWVCGDCRCVFLPAELLTYDKEYPRGILVLPDDPTKTFSVMLELQVDVGEVCMVSDVIVDRDGHYIPFDVVSGIDEYHILLREGEVVAGINEEMLWDEMRHEMAERGAIERGDIPGAIVIGNEIWFNVKCCYCEGHFKIQKDIQAWLSQFLGLTCPYCGTYQDEE